MKKKLLVAFLFVLTAVWAAPASAQDVQAILAKMIDAQGGAKALELIKDSEVTGSIDLAQMGMSGALTLTKKDPFMIRIDIEIAGLLISQGFDGQKGWMINPQTGTTDMSELQEKSMRRQALGPQALLHPEKFGITYTLKGRETVAGRDCHVLIQKFGDGYVVTHYVDAATFQIAKTKALAVDSTGSGQEVDSETVLSDYRSENGVLTAHKMTVFQNGAEVMTMTFSTLKVNANPPDSFFKLAK
jgi:outer membrane lipoprotein-sorting protein